MIKNTKKIIGMVLALSFCLASGCKTINESNETDTDTTETTLETVSESTTALAPIINTDISRDSYPTTVATESYDPDITPPPELDTKSPMFLKVQNKVTLIKGDEFKLNSYISYIDNYDRTPKVTQEGEVDTTTPGTYNIKVILEDYAGNKKSSDIKVTVLAAKPTKKPGSSSSSSEPEKTIQFADFIKNYKADGLMFGIDVSRWNEKIDFEKVKAAGCEFVIMRSGVYYDGDFHADSCFYENFKNAKAAGLKVGVYMYTVDNDEKLLREHVDSLCKDILKGEKLDFPIAFDWESWGHFQNYKMSMRDMNNLFYAFCDQLEKNGYEGMLYASKSKLLEIWEPKDYPVWLAHYTKKTTYEGDYIMWQVDEVGRIDGIKGNVDINIYYGKDN